MNASVITLDQFEGPLDLLLRLVEDQEMDITQVALADVTDQYLRTLRASPIVDPDILADFLVIAARLVWMKSKVLIPALADAEEDVAAENLERQLRELKLYRDAAKDVHRRMRTQEIAYARERYPRQCIPERFVPPRNLSGALLADLFRGIVKAVEPFLPYPTQLCARAISIEEKIASMREALLARLTARFHDLVGEGASKVDMIVSFLALLELVKQRLVSVDQPTLFGDIAIAHDTSHDP